MKIIHSERGGGKSSTLIRMASKNHAYIICANKTRCGSLNKMAMEMGALIPHPITIHELLNLRGIRIDKIYIDDVEDVLAAILPANLEAVTTSCDITELSPKNTDEPKLEIDEPIEALGLSTRSLNSLKRADISTIKDLTDMSRNDFRMVRNFGNKSLREIIDTLAQYNLSIKKY